MMFGKCLDEDLKTIADKEEYRQLYGSSILISGATGLIGLSLTRLFIYMNEVCHADIQIHLCIRNEEKLRRLLGEYTDRPYIRLHTADIVFLTSVDGNIDYVFHCAGITNSKMMITRPVDTILVSVNGTENILKTALDKQVKSAVYLSSMEMYGSLDGEVDETEPGCVNPLAVRSCYPESKRLCENLCVAYHSQYALPVKIARLAQTFGAGILPGENRVFARFAKSAMAKEDIVLHTKGTSAGNYCYLSDALEALLVILLKGENGEAYNIANESMHMEIRQMAALVADEIANGQICVKFDIRELSESGYAPETHMHLKADKLRELGWTSAVGMRDAYLRMMCDMEGQND